MIYTWEMLWKFYQSNFRTKILLFLTTSSLNQIIMFKKAQISYKRFWKQKRNQKIMIRIAKLDLRTRKIYWMILNYSTIIKDIKLPWLLISLPLLKAKTSKTELSNYKIKPKTVSDKKMKIFLKILSICQLVHRQILWIHKKKKLMKL